MSRYRWIQIELACDSQESSDHTGSVPDEPTGAFCPTIVTKSSIGRDKIYKDNRLDAARRLISDREYVHD